MLQYCIPLIWQCYSYFSTFKQQLNIEMPSFNLYNHSFSNLLSYDKKYHVSLKEMAKVTKKDGIIFQTLAEPLAEGLVDIKGNWPDLNGYLGIIGTAIVSVTFVYCIWSFFKIRKLGTTLLILEHSIPTLPSFKT